MLRYKSVWYGNDIVEIDKFYPSSKLCSVCGHKNNDLKLSEREWECNDCGSVHDRDKNAAINILNEGMKLYKNKIPTRCGESTPLESSDNTLDELGNLNLHNFV
jgi:putative transposase